VGAVHQLEHLIALAERIGYRVRYEDFGGCGGGRCEFGGQRYLFIDLSLNSVEQLEHVRTALSQDPSLPVSGLAPGDSLTSPNTNTV
jgi:hypothetical protein